MKLNLSSDKLINYLARQLSFHFPDDADLNDLTDIVNIAIERLRFCFENTKYSPYWRNNFCYFDYLNADQYLVFLYFCSRSSFQLNNINLATKFFYLNKVLHSFHCMYDTILPDIFLVVHGSGIVLGKAIYNNYSVFMHGCTVGANSKFEIPTLGKFLFMYPNSTITGNCFIDDNCCLSNGAHVNDEVLLPNSLVFGSSPHLTIKRNRRDRLSHVYEID